MKCFSSVGMNRLFSLAATSRLIAAAVVAILLQSGAAAITTHPGDGCNDDFCSTLQCDMAVGNGCGNLCVPAALTPAVLSASDPAADISLTARSAAGPGLRLPDRPFRPPALA
ncbi:MAG: hypothetical protein ACT4UQ_11390 [Gammaproteobacteria bacterium]